MLTSNQLKSIRKKKYKRNFRKNLESCPQKKGQCLKILTLSPKKPNSTNSKIEKGRLTSCYYNLYRFLDSYYELLVVALTCSFTETLPIEVIITIDINSVLDINQPKHETLSEPKSLEVVSKVSPMD